MKWFALILLFIIGITSYPLGSFTVKNKDCSYTFDTEQNVITVSCGRNVTVSIRNENGSFEISGNRKHYLWFEKGSNGQLSGRFRTPIKTHTGNKSENSHRATQKLKNANSILKKIKKRLGIRTRKLKNITYTLQDGDEALKRDLANFAKLNLGSLMGKQATVAALTHQYQFLSSAMLSQNSEMKTFISDMSNLISATQKSVRSFMTLHDQLQEEILLMNMALIKSNISRVEKPTGRYLRFRLHCRPCFYNRLNVSQWGEIDSMTKLQVDCILTTV